MKRMLLALFTLISFSLTTFAAVNINTATQADLESLDGIGPVKAKAILEYRKKNGNFKSIDDLDKVDGIGPVTLKNMRKDIVIGGIATSKPANTKPVQTIKAEPPKKLAATQKVIIANKENKPAAKVVTSSKTSTQKKVTNKSIAKKSKPTKSKTNKPIKVKTK